MTARLLYNYEITPIRVIDPRPYAVTVETTVIRVPGIPDLVMDQADDNVRWVSITPEGEMTCHETLSRHGFDHGRWVQWTLVMALYDEALDPSGNCRARHGYDVERLTSHQLGALTGSVLEGCRECSAAPPNPVANEVVRAVGGPDLPLRGTVAWLGDLTGNPGEPGGYDSLDLEHIGVLSGLALNWRARK
ncbi:hypothetical protein [Actinokineospora inagensis]|uniref:hypothetical protein n=1 Tax=Actinokineospora inagensis TaxID=103730 RepID=UPI0003F9C6D7|nr:hypothetical protein [Actinokineospora inagensis]